jgi:hypothetical protein
MVNALYAECHAGCHYAKCLFAECRFAECRGTLIGPCIACSMGLYNKTFTAVVFAVWKQMQYTLE